MKHGNIPFGIHCALENAGKSTADMEAMTPEDIIEIYCQHEGVANGRALWESFEVLKNHNLLYMFEALWKVLHK